MCHRLAVFASPIVLLASSVFAQVTINVPADQPTIQAGINAAADGDTVLVAPGTYNEVISFGGLAITVRSSGGPAVTRIDASGAVDPGAGLALVRFENGEGADSVLEGFGIDSGTGDISDLGSQTVGGGIYINGASPTIRDCILKGNSADLGGGVFVRSGVPTFERCEFQAGDADLGAGVCIVDGGATFNECIFRNNTGVTRAAGLAIFNNIAEVRITGTTFTNNTSSGTNGGCIYGDLDAPLIIDGCLFEDSRTDGGRGGAVLVDSGDAIVLNSVFHSNRVESSGAIEGGGALAFEGNTAVVANCLFTLNLGDSLGGAIYSSAQDTVIGNCTFTGNFGDFGAAIHSANNAGTSTHIFNSIMWQNGGLVPQIATTSALGTFSVDYCIVENGWTGPGANNLDTDPMFANPTSDYTLLPGSPAIDAGDTVSAAGLLTASIDVGGGIRLINDPDTADTGTLLFGSAIDIGAYEVQLAAVPDCPADQNFDGILTPADFNAWIINYNNGCD